MFAIAAMFVTGCGRKEPPKVEDVKSPAHPSRTKDDGVEHKVLSFNLEGLTDKGDKKWEVIGRTARSISENEIMLGDIIAKTYGDQEAVITANHGIYDKSKNNVRLEKNVKATIENAGSVIKDQIGFSIDSPGPKKTGAEEMPEKSKVKKKITITCDGDVEFNYAKNLAYFRKNVKVRSEDGDIDADKITVNLDPSTKKINDIVAEGHVKITQKENTAYSDTAKYNEADKTVSLRGNPKIEIAQGSDVVKEKFIER
jgi:lipopolysaccharide transport protein LptA